MNHVNSLIRLIDQGVATQVMLNDGSMILQFCPQDIIARGSSQAGIVVVRGLIYADDQPPQDRVVPLRDICGVSSGPLRQNFPADPEFSLRNPVPRGWTMVHSRLQDTGLAR